MKNLVNITILICLAAWFTGCIERNGAAGQAAKSSAARRSAVGTSNTGNSATVACVSTKITDLLMSGGGEQAISGCVGAESTVLGGGSMAERQNASNIEVFYSSPDADGYYMMMTVSDLNHSFQIDIFNELGLSQSAAYAGVIMIDQDLVFQFSAESAGLAGQEMVATVDGSNIVLNGSTFVPAE